MFKLFIVGALLCMLCSCELIFDKDISGETITLLSPGDSTSNEELTQTLWWESHQDVSEYRIQIVTPDFEDTRIMYEDTLVSSTSFTIDLVPEDYKWRVRGENSFDNYTAYSLRGFRVDSSKDISDEQVDLLLPGDGEDKYVETIQRA